MHNLAVTLRALDEPSPHLSARAVGRNVMADDAARQSEKSVQRGSSLGGAKL
jgi:hypothetical protein